MKVFKCDPEVNTSELIENLIISEDHLDHKIKSSNPIAMLDKYLLKQLKFHEFEALHFIYCCDHEHDSQKELFQ